MQWPATSDGHPVVVLLDLGPHRFELTRHYRQAIGFFHSQF